MHHSLRALSIVLVSASLSLVLGCSGDGGGGDRGDGGGGSGPTTGDGGSTSAQAMDWSGTWDVQLDYGVDCDYGLGNVKHGDLSFSNTMTLTVSGGSVTADIMGYQMEGTGGDDRLKLNGQYPVRDENQSVAGDVDASNNITLDIDTILDADSAKGTISGTFDGQFGATCTISNGQAALSR